MVKDCEVESWIRAKWDCDKHLATRRKQPVQMVDRVSSAVKSSFFGRIPSNVLHGADGEDVIELALDIEHVQILNARSDLVLVYNSSIDQRIWEVVTEHIADFKPARLSDMIQEVRRNRDLNSAFIQYRRVVRVIEERKIHAVEYEPVFAHTCSLGVVLRDTE